VRRPTTVCSERAPISEPFIFNVLCAAGDAGRQAASCRKRDMQEKRIITRVLNKSEAPVGRPPAIVLIDPKYAHNVGMVVRLASCYGLSQVWFTGERVSLDISFRKRLPREERMKGYADVEIINYDYPFEQFADVIPVAVEVRKNSESLHSFEHPQNAVYVFGPEDGSVSKPHISHCHRFVVIPTKHCLNLATAVATILWDRQYKGWLGGEQGAITTPGEFEGRGLVEFPDDIVW
jgi:tRNA(Leu) C34 or U34 (ribose-2'-O)-methylase TrmL